MGVVRGRPCAINGADASRCRSDGAEVGVYGFLVDDIATLPIFWLSMMSVTEEAAVRIAASLVGGSKVWPCQTNIADTKLHSAGRGAPVGAYTRRHARESKTR
ncbi:hypothetical protein MHU86_5970 [Fragilaria crotonensis]|nr:hypothetical protein MHU86_5970 [Fragilaria crotonensis]